MKGVDRSIQDWEEYTNGHLNYMLSVQGNVQCKTIRDYCGMYLYCYCCCSCYHYSYC